MDVLICVSFSYIMSPGLCSPLYHVSLAPAQILLKSNKMSSAEEMAAAFEEDGGKDLSTASGKRTKAERVEHKHSTQPGGDTRKVVQTATNGETKRKEK